MPKKSIFKGYLSEFIEGLLLILWIIASGATNMGTTFTLLGALVIFGVSVAYFISKRYFDTKSELAKLNQQKELEKHKIFYDSTKSLIVGSEKNGIQRMERLKTCQAIVSLLEKRMKEETLTPKEKIVYLNIIKTIRELEDFSTQF